MRKMKFLTIAAAMFAASTMLTSCWSSEDDPADKPAEISDLVAENLTIVASSNAEAVFSIDATATVEQDADKKGAKFTEIKANTVKVTAKLLNANGYVTDSQTAVVNFSKKNTNVAIAFDFAKRSTDTATQADVAASATDITIASNMSEEVEAAMTIPAGTTITSGSSTESFSVTAYEVPADIVADVKVGQTLGKDAKIFALDCTPDGCTFSKDIVLTVFAGKSLAGKTLTIENNGEKVTSTVKEDGTVTFPVPHFSDWYLLLDATVIQAVSGSVTLMNNGTVNIVAGKNEFTYTKNTGVRSNINPNVDPVLAAEIRSKLGDEASVIEETGSFTSNKAATVNLEIIQNYTDYVLEYQGVRFEARIWENVKAIVSVPGGSSHSGGASADL